MFGRRPHLVYFGRPIWHIGFSWYTADSRHHSTLDSAKAWVRKQQQEHA